MEVRETLVIRGGALGECRVEKVDTLVAKWRSSVTETERGQVIERGRKVLSPERRWTMKGREILERRG